MILRAGLLALVLCAPVGLGGPVAAQTLEESARTAAAQLIAAGDMLVQAERASDRIAALTGTVRAYEDGLAALRGGLRQVNTRERVLAAALEDRRAEIARLLGALARIGHTPAPLLTLHPSGPVGAVQAGQMVAAVTPALQAQADVLRADMAALVGLRALQTRARVSLEEGLAGVQTARTELATAMSNRTERPQRFVQDSDAMAALVQNADTLAGFADGLGDLAEANQTPEEGLSIGALPAPVTGQLLRAFQEADAAGIRRPGWLIATAPGALVTSPLDATIRYAGPLLDQGQVIILEPAPGALVILAGMSEVYGSPGVILAPGDPVGVMGGTLPRAQDFLLEVGQDGGAGRSETLYIEVRDRNTPVDPAGWFAP
jgi:septal ring factor EnvC (AmiA/AmiB activator)